MRNSPAILCPSVVDCRSRTRSNPVPEIQGFSFFFFLVGSSTCLIELSVSTMQQDHRKKSTLEMEFFSEYGDANRFEIQEVIGKGSYGVVCSARDTLTGEKVAIKKIHNIFEHISDAARILREIKLLRLLKHPDIVEIKHIMLSPSRREFKDIFVVFELMESDLHQVIKANDDLTREHYQFFLYQLLRALKYMHTANVYHRDLKPKNILANANCKLKICDFGLARVAFSDTPTTVFWTDYVATRWYRAPELCGSFYSKYTPAIDIWSIGCIFAEVLTGKPIFPGKNVVHQLDLMTDLLGTPSLDTISSVRNEKARKYLISMRKKPPIPFAQKFPNADPLALKLLERLLAFDSKDRPTAEEALADPYFKGLARVEREPSCQPITKMEFEFERRKVTKEDIRELVFQEILEYHPQLLKDYMNGTDRASFLYPSVVDQFRRRFAHLEENGGKPTGSETPLERKHVSLPRSTVVHSSTVSRGGQPRIAYNTANTSAPEMVQNVAMDQQSSLQAHELGNQSASKPSAFTGPVAPFDNRRTGREAYDPRSFIRSTTSIPAQAACAYRNPNIGPEFTPEVAIDIDNNPFIMTQTGMNKAESISIDTNLLQATRTAQYGGIGAAAGVVGAAAGLSASAYHRKVGTVQYGMSKMY
ncbi:PREDICTED: mitogen-activated protein kinase 20-like [Tarenaya hassleriana]|uniref:mitogen-activated protein kinase 20-like n=1 Tax=Tarenaya hassleriana TaxID=28532 RepID=UPI00053CA753|nr:PREDICTED: mitogen-activated protein kinase 20-like [Tarenaya hassleriana]